MGASRDYCSKTIHDLMNEDNAVCMTDHLNGIILLNTCKIHLSLLQVCEKYCASGALKKLA